MDNIRLKQEYCGFPPEEKLFFLRILKESVHKTGHFYGLGHCSNSSCVMFFSNSLRDTDKKQANFCINCRKRIND